MEEATWEFLTDFGAAESEDLSDRAPLRVHPDNPAYFMDYARKAVCLTGFHTWDNLQDMGDGEPPEPFDYGEYLRSVKSHGCNYIRMWRWEMPRYRYPDSPMRHCVPQPWQRTGPAIARDGKPAFDLTKFDARYFVRLRERVERAAREGVYVSVMLFEGHAVQFAEEAWCYHPFAAGNNVNDLDAGFGEGDGRAYYTLKARWLTSLQEAYVRQVVGALSHLGNVLFEICNEAGQYSTEWQYHMIRYIKSLERGKPVHHPVGMTFQFKGGSNANLFAGPADWISPNSEGGYQDDPPPADGRKVVLADTDHLWGIGGKPDWAWKSFVRGLHPVYMDPYRDEDPLFSELSSNRGCPELREHLGYIQRFARGMNLAAMSPHGELVTTSYCLASPGAEYLVYLPEAGSVTVDLSAAKRFFRVSWFEPETGEFAREPSVEGGRSFRFRCPFDRLCILHLKGL